MSQILLEAGIPSSNRSVDNKEQNPSTLDCFRNDAIRARHLFFTYETRRDVFFPNLADVFNTELEFIKILEYSLGPVGNYKEINGRMLGYLEVTFQNALRSIDPASGFFTPESLRLATDIIAEKARIESKITLKENIELVNLDAFSVFFRELFSHGEAKPEDTLLASAIRLFVIPVNLINAPIETNSSIKRGREQAKSGHSRRLQNIEAMRDRVEDMISNHSK